MASFYVGLFSLRRCLIKPLNPTAPQPGSLKTKDKQLGGHSPAAALCQPHSQLQQHSWDTPVLTGIFLFPAPQSQHGEGGESPFLMCFLGRAIPDAQHHTTNPAVKFCLTLENIIFLLCRSFWWTWSFRTTKQSTNITKIPTSLQSRLLQAFFFTKLPSFHLMWDSEARQQYKKARLDVCLVAAQSP